MIHTNNVKFLYAKDRQIRKLFENKNQFNKAPPITAITNKLIILFDIPQASSFKQFNDDSLKSPVKE